MSPQWIGGADGHGRYLGSRLILFSGYSSVSSSRAVIASARFPPAFFEFLANLWQQMVSHTANGVRLAIVQVVQIGQQLVLQSAALASPVHVSALPQN